MHHWDHLVGHHHVGGQAGDQRRGHIPRGGGDGLHGVVLQQREVLAQANRGKHLVGRKGQDDRSDAHTEGPAGLGANVEVGEREDAAD